MRASLTVGGIEVELLAERGRLEGLLTRRYAPFLGAVCDPVGAVRFQTPAEAADRPRAKGPVCLVPPDFSVKLDPSGSGTITTIADPFTVDDAMRHLLAHLAPQKGALLLHGSGVIIGGRAHVFIGPAGSGSSTLARLAGHRPVLTDGYIVVQRVGEQWVAAATPFWNAGTEPGPPRQAPLAGLWLPRASTVTEACPRGVAAADALVDNAVLAGSNPEQRALVLELAFELASTVRCTELHFQAVPAVWAVIEATHAA